MPFTVIVNGGDSQVASRPGIVLVRRWRATSFGSRRIFRNHAGHTCSRVVGPASPQNAHRFVPSDTRLKVLRSSAHTGGGALVARDAIDEVSDWSKLRDMGEASDTRSQVMRLAYEKPDWIPVLQAACVQARKTAPYGGEFAGSWVLQEVKQLTGTPDWRPGLRLLASYGLIEKVGESTRGGRRAYYRMPDPDGVEQALGALPPPLDQSTRGQRPASSR